MKNSMQYIIGIIAGAITATTIVACAANFLAPEISYETHDYSDTHAANIQSALDELYENLPEVVIYPNYDQSQVISKYISNPARIPMFKTKRLNWDGAGGDYVDYYLCINVNNKNNCFNGTNNTELITEMEKYFGTSNCADYQENGNTYRRCSDNNVTCGTYNISGQVKFVCSLDSSSYSEEYESGKYQVDDQECTLPIRYDGKCQ